MQENLNKYSKWVFTLFEDEENQIPSHEQLTEALELISDKFLFQLEECPTTGRRHYQGCFITRIRKRHRTVVYDLAVFLCVEVKLLTIDRMQGTWEQSAEYCSKRDSKVDDKVYKSKSIVEAESIEYQGKDLSVFKDLGLFSWQQDVSDLIFKDDTFTIKDSSCREVIWITDEQGNSGKSLFTKYLCYNNAHISKLAFGSGSQMRSAVVEEGAKKCYIIDVPRRLCNDDYQNNIYSVIEDLKNGFVKSSMYGKSKTLFMEPPIVIVFANYDCPTEKLSVDRWAVYSIIHNCLVPIIDERDLNL